jgi:hypothetical protein
VLTDALSCAQIGETLKYGWATRIALGGGEGGPSGYTKGFKGLIKPLWGLYKALIGLIAPGVPPPPPLGAIRAVQPFSSAIDFLISAVWAFRRIVLGVAGLRLEF